jgi:TfoX/Sxy family transcriptional regulator of competence genes
VASDLSFVEFVVEGLDTDCAITQKRMFGEFALYGGGILFSMICDNRLFVKPSGAGRAFIGDVVEAPLYRGAKPSLLIGDRVVDRARLSELVRITARELPPPIPKKTKKKG